MKIHLAYHRDGIELDVPDGNLIGVFEDLAQAPLAAPEDAVRAMLRRPIESAPLAEIAAGIGPRAPRCVIVISDITRPCPNAQVLLPLLAELNGYGIADAQITILVATGLHRRSTPAEWRELVGDEVLGRVEIVDHESANPDTLVTLGTTLFDTTVVMARRWVEADLRILTGLVEPHMMAGFSGGRKGLCPGISGEQTVKRFHAPDMMGHINALPGVIDGNPVNTLSHAVAAMCPPHFLVNVTVNRDKQITGVFAGDYRAAWQAAVRQAEACCRVPVPEPADIVISTSSGYPLDLTYYQGQKGMMAALPILKPGGTLLYAMACAEGIGQREFTEQCARYATLDDFLRAATTRDEVEKDQWALQYLHKVVARHDVLFYSSYLPWETQQGLFVTPVRSMEDGLRTALAKHGPDARITVLPKGAYVLPYLAAAVAPATVA